MLSLRSMLKCVLNMIRHATHKCAWSVMGQNIAVWSWLLTVSSIEQIRRYYRANIVTQIASVVLRYSSRNTECRQLSSPVMTLTFDLFNPSSLPLQRASTLVITLSLDHPATLSIVQLLVVDYHWFYHEFLLSITGALWLQLLAHPRNVLTYLLYLLLDSVQAQCVLAILMAVNSTSAHH